MRDHFELTNYIYLIIKNTEGNDLLIVLGAEPHLQLELTVLSL